MDLHAKIFKALADPIRLRLLLLLHGRVELCVCDLMQALGMPQSTVSRHLAYLKRHGWIQDRRGGTWTYYSLPATPDPFLQDQLTLLVSRLAGNATASADLDRLNAYLRHKNLSDCP